MGTVTEIAQDIYKITIYEPRPNMQFNHFLVLDDRPLLYHTGSKNMFEEVKGLASRVIDVQKIRWISFSHFEADECGAINQWHRAAPRSRSICTPTAAQVNLADFATRQPRALPAGEILITGTHRFQMLPTPHLPHGWDAGMFFDETSRTLFCSDLFHQSGDPEPLTSHSVIEQARQVLLDTRNGPLGDYIPFTSNTLMYMSQLAALEPHMLATQHGSAFVGDCAQSLLELGEVIHDVAYLL